MEEWWITLGERGTANDIQFSWVMNTNGMDAETTLKKKKIKHIKQSQILV